MAVMAVIAVIAVMEEEPLPIVEGMVVEGWRQSWCVYI